MSGKPYRGTEPDKPFPPDPDAGYVRPHAGIHDDLLKANIEIYELKRELARLLALETRVFQFVAMGEPITVEAFSDLASGEPPTW